MTTNLSTILRKNEAEDHLRDIRRRKGVDHPNAEHDDNVRDLNRALGM